MPDERWRTRDELGEPGGRVWVSDGRAVWTSYVDGHGNVAPRAKAARFWMPFRTPDPPDFDNVR